MEEDNRYYTPSIEEFRVGFEIELLVEGVWIKIPYMQNFEEGEGKPTILEVYQYLVPLRLVASYQVGVYQLPGASSWAAREGVSPPCINYLGGIIRKERCEHGCTEGHALQCEM